MSSCCGVFCSSTPFRKTHQKSMTKDTGRRHDRRHNEQCVTQCNHNCSKVYLRIDHCQFGYRLEEGSVHNIMSVII